MGFSSASADSALMDFDPPSRAQLTVDWSMVKGWPSIVAEKEFSAAGLVWAVLVGADLSKTEEIKAPVAWASPRNHAMTRCFRCASVCFRCAFGVALHGAQADLLRFGHLAPSMRRADTRAGLSTMCPVQAVVLSCSAVRE